MLTETKVAVFWDVEECPVPDGVEPSVVCENIKLALEKKGYRPCNVSIRVYGERTNKFKDDFLLADIMFLPAGKETQYLSFSFTLCPYLRDLC